jgi:hypothetical protein
MALSQAERQQIIETAYKLRSRPTSSPSAGDADLGWLPPAGEQAVAPIGDPRFPDQSAAAMPSPWSERMKRERRALEIDELERRAATAKRRQAEQRRRLDISSSAELDSLRNATAELAANANAAVSAIVDNLDSLRAEITALRHRVEGIEKRRKARTGKRNELPSFLPSRTLAS